MLMATQANQPAPERSASGKAKNIKFDAIRRQCRASWGTMKRSKKQTAIASRHAAM
jgi:hypothetical protein